MKLARRLALPVLAATVALVVLLALRPLSTSRALAIWVVLVAAIALVLLVRHSRVGAGRRSRFDAALRPREPENPLPAELQRMERELVLGIADATYAHRRLLPLLRAAAAARLAWHGIELDRRPGEAEALLGDDAWELLRPDRPEPGDRHGPGVPRERVADLIERIESL
ncbi:MAG: hypothetical protein ACJ75G_09280 [Gaiellaceae bacterium]